MTVTTTGSSSINATTHPMPATPATDVANSSNSSTSTLIPGETRIRDADGFVGTVMYVGPVASSKRQDETYAGIMWDDPSRGKHDGSVVSRTTNRLVRHFSGGCGPTQGSFLKLRLLDLGIPLTADLLKERYVDMDAPILAPNNELPHTVRTSTGRQKTIEFLGELNIRQHQQPETMNRISLRREGISKAMAGDTNTGKDNDLAEFHHIKDVDLAGNLLSNWNETTRIMIQFPALEVFSIAHNRVRDIPPNDSGFSLTVADRQFDRLRVLNVNNCGIQSFRTVVWISQAMPNLESLCVANSNLSDIENYSDQILDRFRCLTSLDCSNCHFDRWKGQVDAFAKLPQLGVLSLEGNPLSSVPMDAGIEFNFPALTSLQLSCTKIATWSDLEGVNSVGLLKSLRFKNAPLTETLGQHEARTLLIARFPQLESLNASVITSTERTEAERRYVTLVTHMLQREGYGEEAGDNSNGSNAARNENSSTSSLLQGHSMYTRLRDKHKDMAIFSTNRSGMTAKGGGPSTLSADIVNVTLRSLAASSCTMEPIVRRLPGTLDVGRLRAMCARIYGLDYGLVSLRCRPSNNKDSIPVELDEDDRTLTYFGAGDGTEILVDERDIDGGDGGGT